jgi:hypothetical protein
VDFGLKRLALLGKGFQVRSNLLLLLLVCRKINPANVALLAAHYIGIHLPIAFQIKDKRTVLVSVDLLELPCHLVRVLGQVPNRALHVVVWESC